MRHRFALAVLLFAVSACESNSPFVYHEHTLIVSKDVDQVRKYGYFIICHGEDDADKATALAEETCAQYGLQAHFRTELRYQCSLTEPHQTQYSCINPAMRMQSGSYINPLNKGQVRDWKDEQANLKRKSMRAKKMPTTSEPAIPAPPNDDSFNLSPGGWGQAWDDAAPTH